MKYILYTIIFLLLPVLGSAQERIKSSGNLPKDFTSKIKSKRSSSQKKTKLDKAQDSFETQSGYSIKQMMRSGVVLFNDPATKYLNEVLAKLPYKAKSRTKAPRVYALNSPAVNAFATNEGVICVTLGLLARLEDEAQLAFILSHELMHVEHKHAVKTFVHKYESKKKDKKNKKSGISKEHNHDHEREKTGQGNHKDFDPAMLKSSMFSHSLETEADDEGLELFRKSGYSTESLTNVFEILFYADMPFDNCAVDKTLFDFGSYKLPSDKWPSGLVPLRPFEHYEDNLSTHPSSYKRQESLAKKIKKSDGSKAKYLVGEFRFDEVKELAQFQMPYLHLESGDYVESIYTAHVLDKKNKYGAEFKKVIGKALYQEMSRREVKEKDDNKKEKKEVRGQVGLVYHLISELSKKEITTLAAQYNLDLSTKLKDDKELDIIVKACFIEMKEHYHSLSEFKMNEKTIYWQHAFSEPHVSKRADTEFGARSKMKFKGGNATADLSNKKKKEISKKGLTLGLKNVLVVNPSFVSVHGRSKSLQCERSELKEAQLLKSFKEFSRKTKVKAAILDPTVMSVRDASKMNDLQEIKKFVSQVMSTDMDKSIIPTNYGEIQEIAKRYKTKNFLVPLMMSSSKNIFLDYAVGTRVIASMYQYLFYPTLMTKGIFKNRSVIYASMLINAETGTVTIVDMKRMKTKDTQLHIDMMVYNTLYQLGAR